MSPSSGVFPLFRNSEDADSDTSYKASWNIKDLRPFNSIIGTWYK
jgi:hypothetical protein